MRPTCPFRRPLCTTLAAVVMIMGMPACAGDPPDDQPAEGDAAAEGPAGDAGAVDDVGAEDEVDETTLTTSVAATRAVGRARVELQITVAGPDGPVALVHRAAFTDGGLRAEASSDMSEAAAALEAAGQELEGDWSHPTGVVIDGDAVYSQLGPMAEALGHEPDDWVRARIADVTAAGAENDALALALDPLGPADLLYRPVREVAVVGADDVRGVHTRHLRATLDLTGAQAAPPASFEARLVAAGVDALPVDVWLDDAGVVRRLLVSLDEAGTMTTTFDVFDVDADVAVTPPAPDQVVALTPPPADGAG
jgi:hypothetical protein